MRLLVLGGTDFVGRAVAEEAVARGWRVTLFNRGTRQPPAGAQVRTGDRDAEAELAALESGAWDAVVDTWTGAPRAVRDAARLLAGRVGHYAYISSGSVYAWPSAAGSDEGAPLVAASADAGATEYAQDKRGGELAAEEVFGERALFVRAGLILGPYENIGRLPWWLRRIAQGGGPVLAPGPYGLELQYIDARDLASWTLDAAERGLGGPYNMVSPPGHTTMGELLDLCVQVTGSGAELRWIEPERILAAGLEPWTQLPIWLPPGELHAAIHQTDVSKALAAGLRCRPVAETVSDTWAWLCRNPGWEPHRSGLPPVGLPPEAEARVLGWPRAR
ncbi:NAD-dependent epimerase/dehydratase family protein [Streptomyces gobiensis]|uniref:NAD-dependent epimerase/dehydratase family protein n=1 Tax=Streptomyces gobiensis TaxID=2875706 RepID=UPI001E65A0DB|nr:NAD-dependent epimerase/dehydratase family protein [Streptomyces gobiensis]UGY94243.1 reductase [Streptomyces gobiensis]